MNINIIPTIKGALKYQTLIKKEDTQKALCLSNISDLNIIIEYEAKLVRISDKLAFEYAKMFKIVAPYWIIIGQPSDTIFDIAKNIVDLNSTLEIKPKFYACINEDNTNSYEKVEAIRNQVKNLQSDFPIPIVKGPTSACIEGGAFPIYEDYFSGNKRLDVEDPHILHFYLAPWNISNLFENYRRIYLLTYIVIELKKRGVKNIIIAESHDASMTKSGYPEQGDFVYASKEGQDKIEEVASKLGISYVGYYQSAFLHYDGNTVLKK